VRVLLAIEGGPDPAEIAETITLQGWPTNTEVRILSLMRNGPSSRSFGAKREEWAGKHTDELPKQVHNLATMVAEVLRAGDLTISVVAHSPETPKEIVAEARDWQADLILLGGHFDAVQGWLSDGAARWIVEHAPCCVKVISVAQANVNAQKN
jgi:nucleotide-binding universal stress UspA family protein